MYHADMECNLKYINLDLGRPSEPTYPTEPYRNTSTYPQEPMATKLATNRTLEGYGGIS